MRGADVLALVAGVLTNTEMAARGCFSPGTVGERVERILTRTGQAIARRWRRYVHELSHRERGLRGCTAVRPTVVPQADHAEKLTRGVWST